MAKKFTLDNIRRVLNELTEAHIKSPVISVAGTNGKGSAANFIASALEAEGLSAGLYTSPHIASFTERIKINGESIEGSRLLELYKSVRRESKRLGVELSKFEKLTACAILYFEEEGVDLSVMEAGLGGRLDATNVCENKVVSVITRIAQDHTDFLGESLEEIAREKAGIITSRRPVVDASGAPEVRLAAEKAGAPVFTAGTDFVAANIRKDVCGRYKYDFMMDNVLIEDLSPAMSGRYQVDNSAAAAACLLLAGISSDSLRRGIGAAQNRGRLQEIDLGGGRRLLADAAHNPDGLLTLREHIKEMNISGRVYLIMGVLKDKNYIDMAEIISGAADYAWTLRPSSSRGLPAEKLASLIKNSKPSASAKEALIEAAGKMLPGDLLVACGSFFILGDLFRAVDELHI